VNLRRRQQRSLRDIERELAHSEPDLDALFLSFARHVARREVPQLEKMSHWPPRMLTRLRLRRGRTRAEPTSDRCAENWNDP
jgi:hypothetical protein